MGKPHNILKDLIREHNSDRQGLRSAKEYKKLLVPCTRRSTFADRAFSVNGLKKWNALPGRIKENSGAQSF